MQITDEQMAEALRSFRNICWCWKRPKSKADRERGYQRYIGASQILRDLGFTAEEIEAMFNNA